ncbi:hypothetical protein [Hanstruepera marina]|uniref:hypothetical protein n=1 Tax=Hanstruepera marina TaxID=2873265 RepID=UPI001CA7986B|nr:hypothetical protein [Hanstruepera marina]
MTVNLKSENYSNYVLPVKHFDSKCQIIIDYDMTSSLSFFDLEIIFQYNIVKFRNYDYKWTEITGRCIANWYAPKIIQLANGKLVQANRNIGIWEINKKEPNKLLWRFNPENAQPLTRFKANSHDRQIKQTQTTYNFDKPLALLLPGRSALEVSRSKIPFSAILCFTDHCDFDTLKNLKQQRLFFKQHSIKTTKGFFLNHYSKRDDNAAMEYHANEYKAWIDDGHELAYHALSQSIKPNEEGFKDFENFTPPLDNINTWIDHGYQPYNVSCFENYNLSVEQYGRLLHDKNISILWNYSDSGTCIPGVINQINPSHFTLQAFLKGIKGLGVLESTRLWIKNLLTNNLDHSNYNRLYKDFANNLKKRKWAKCFRSAFGISKVIISTGLHYNSKKYKVNTLAKYTPLFFRHRIGKVEFYIFQTMEMVDFKQALNPRNINTLIEEKGICIAHTYFSVPLKHHKGRLIIDGRIDSEVNKNFACISKKISEKKLWNPTVKELITYLAPLEYLEFDVTEEGGICLISENHFTAREVTI